SWDIVAVVHRFPPSLASLCTRAGLHDVMRRSPAHEMPCQASTPISQIHPVYKNVRCPTTIAIVQQELFQPPSEANVISSWNERATFGTQPQRAAGRREFRSGRRRRSPASSVLVLRSWHVARACCSGDRLSRE